MSKLDDLLNDIAEGERSWIYDQLDGTSFIKNELDLVDNKVSEAKQQLKDLMLELVGQPEQRETDDMSLKSWTPDDYKAFGRNELIVKLRNEIEQL